jgi:hypothetical protein
VIQSMWDIAHRAPRAVGLGLLMALAVAGPASAKGTPFFTIEMSPRQPVASEAVVVAVRTWEDVAHTIPARLETTAALDRLLVFRRVAGDSPDIPVPLRYRGPGEFHGTVVLPTAGDWTLVAFPDRTGWASPEVPPGYPDTIAFTVRAASDGLMLMGALAALAVVIVIVGTVVVVGRFRQAARDSVVHNPNAT